MTTITAFENLENVEKTAFALTKALETTDYR
jgi:hypothetical protein